MKHFEELIAWQKAVEIAKETYLKTKKFPTEERYGLTSQMRRSAVSISSNIAEGFGRYRANDKKRFYSIALGSLLELRSQVHVACEVAMMTEQDKEYLLELLTENHKLISALSKSVKENP